MSKLILTTFDWVPESPRGYVRDIRVRWALEEASLPYRVESVPAPAFWPGAVVDRRRAVDLREWRSFAALGCAQ
jgi:hypothetical protein